MNRDNIEVKFSNSKQVLGELEKLVKSLPADWKTHEMRMSFLMFLNERIKELHDLELSLLEQSESSTVAGV